MVSPNTENIVWAPQEGPQLAATLCPVYEIFYGGARGGCKSDTVLGRYGLKQARYGAGFNGIVFRKTMPSQDDLISRSREIYEPLGAVYKEQKMTWLFAGGGRLRFRSLETIQDAEKYQGQNLSDATVEEAGLYPDPAPIMRLNAVLRSAAGVPTQLFLTGNPGGPGQFWLKERYVDPHPAGNKVIRQEYPTLPGLPPMVRERVFIPSRVTDNKILLAKDPGYVASLRMVGSNDLVNAWLFGRWDGAFGRFFDKFKPETHVVEPFPIPSHWRRYCGHDWGFSPDPWVTLWFAVDDHGNEWLYREATGNKMLPSAVGAQCAALSDGELITLCHAGTDCWTKKEGVDVAERMMTSKWFLVPADTSRELGWQRVHEYLYCDDRHPPKLRIFSNCKDTIRAVEQAQHDEKNPCDVGAFALDHWLDALRYHLMSRPAAARLPDRPPPRNSVAWFRKHARKVDG